MATVYTRPTNVYESTTTSVNATKYRDDSQSSTPISSSKVDGDINQLIDAVNNLGVDIDNIVGGSVPDGSITEAKLATDAVTNVKVADNAINTAEIVDGAVTNIKLATNSVNTAQIVDEAITSAKIANSQITTDKIANGAVTPEKLSGTIRPEGFIDDTVVWTSSNTVQWSGECTADDGTLLSVDSSTPITATLSAGTANTTYHMFVGFDSVDTVVAEFDTNVDGSGLSTITGSKRRIISIVTDGSSNIIQFNSQTDASGALRVFYDTEIIDKSTFTTGLYDITVPTGLLINPIATLTARNTGPTPTLYTVRSTENPNLDIIVAYFISNSVASTVYTDSGLTTSVAQANLTSGGTGEFRHGTLGYIDERNV